MILLLLHAASTLFMTGLIWFVQVVHYPLGAVVGADAFSAYQAAHMRRTGWVVGPPMLVEAACAAALVVSPATAGPTAWLGLGLLALVWGSTALLQVPNHNALLAGPDPARLRSLVTGNWVRTVGWTARSALALSLLNGSGAS